MKIHKLMKNNHKLPTCFTERLIERNKGIYCNIVTLQIFLKNTEVYDIANKNNSLPDSRCLYVEK